MVGNDNNSATSLESLIIGSFRSFDEGAAKPGAPARRNRSRSSDAGVSDAFVSAGRAEPIDEAVHPSNLTIFFEPVTRTSSSDPKEIVMSDPRSTPVLLEHYR